MFGQCIRKVNCKRHTTFSFITSVAKHHPLITCTEFICIISCRIHAHRDIDRLLMQRATDFTSISKSILRVCVAYISNYRSGASFVINCCLCSNLTHNVYGVTLCSNFTSTSAKRIFCKQFVQNPISDLIAQLVWMPFCD